MSEPSPAADVQNPPTTPTTSPTPSSSLDPNVMATMQVLSAIPLDRLAEFVDSFIATKLPTATPSKFQLPPPSLHSPLAERSPASSTIKNYVSNIAGFIDDEKTLPWGGGKPNVNYTRAQALDDNPRAKLHPRTPACHRDPTSKESTRMFNTITAFNADVGTLEPSKGLYQFGSKLLQVFENSGIDTTTYSRPMPGQPDIRVNVMTDYDGLTAEHVRASHEKDRPLWRAMDFQNDTMARTLLLKHLSSDLKALIEPFINENDSFQTIFMRLVSICVDSSVEKIDRQRTALKSLKLSQFPNMNVLHCTASFAAQGNELHSAKHWDHALVLVLCRIFCDPSCPSESMRNKFHTIRDQVERALPEISCLSYFNKNKAMIEKGLHYSQICDVANTKYLSLLHNGEWPPALQVRDSQAPEINICSTDKMSDAEIIAFARNGGINALVQKTVSQRLKSAQDKSKANEKEKEKPGKAASENNKDSSHHDWRATPPKDDEPTMIFKHKRCFNWCARCKRWTPTHNTETHQSKKSQEPEPKQEEAHHFYQADSTSFFDD
jgi:hypothetical protein